MKFTITKPDGDEQHGALQDDQIARVDRADQQAADARQRKDRLDDQRAADQAADIDAGDRDQRQRRWFQACTNRMRDGLQALGLGDRDIVLLQGGDHVGAQHPHQHRPFGEGQGQRRQHEAAQVAERVFGERHVAGRRQPGAARRQTDRSAGWPRGRSAATACRRPSPVMKRSNAPPLFAAQTMASGTPITSPVISASTISSIDTGRRSATACSTVCAGAERAAEIALQHVAEPAEVAPPDRQIEPHVVAQRRNVLRRRLIAEDHVGEIAGQQRGDQEGEQGDGKQDRQQIEQPSDDEAEHERSTPARRRRRRSRRRTSWGCPSGAPWRWRSRCSGRSRTRSPPC